MSRWYVPPSAKPCMADLELDVIAGRVLTATHQAVIGYEFFSPTEYGLENGLVYRWFAPASTSEKDVGTWTPSPVKKEEHAS